MAHDPTSRTIGSVVCTRVKRVILILIMTPNRKSHLLWSCGGRLIEHVVERLSRTRNSRKRKPCLKIQKDPRDPCAPDNATIRNRKQPLILYVFHLQNSQVLEDWSELRTRQRELVSNQFPTPGDILQT